jgi:hypothetical protein
MAEGNGVPPLPRRVPGASDSPRPSRIEQPVLPEPVRQRLLTVLAEEQERTARESETSPPEEVAAGSQAQPMRPGGTGPPQRRTPSRAERDPPRWAAALGKAGSPHKAGCPEPAERAERIVPLPRQSPEPDGRPVQPPQEGQGSVPGPPSVVPADASTEPIPRISAPAAEGPGAPVNPDITEAAKRPEPPAPVPDAPTAAAPAAPPAEPPAPYGRRGTGQQAGRRQRRPGGRYRAAGVLLSVAALIAAGSLALTLHGHGVSAAGPRGHRQLPVSGSGQLARDQAAEWVAAQIARPTIVSADPAMCRLLGSHGIPAGDIYELGPEATSPLRSAVVVETPAVRTQFGTLLNSVYAPAVLASFGSGRQRVDIREIARHGTAAYRSLLAADLAARRNSAAELLRSNRITASSTAREQLLAGRVDARLQLTVAAMAAKRPVYIVAFNSFAPGSDASLPVRFADLTQALPARLAGSRPATPAFVRSMAAFLRGPAAPYRPLRVAAVRLADGRTVLRIGFAAPSPLGLLGPA